VPARPAGSAHLHLGVWAQEFGGGPQNVSPHFWLEVGGGTEEGKRLFLLTNERRRRHGEMRQLRTTTIPGLGSPRVQKSRHDWLPPPLPGTGKRIGV